MVRVVALQPGILRGGLRDSQALAQRRAALLAEHDLAHLLQTDARDEVVCALLVVGVLAVELQEGRGDAQRLRVGLHGREDVGLADIAARRAAGAHLPAALDGDAADVLHGRLGAVARAARDARLHLVRGVQALPELLHLDPQADGVAEAEAAEVRADAGLDGSHGLGVRVAGRHPEVAPDRR